MIQEKTYYTLICDRCGASFGDEYDDADQAEDIATASGWAIQDRRHYCPDCHAGYDPEKDTYRIYL